MFDESGVCGFWGAGHPDGETIRFSWLNDSSGSVMSNVGLWEEIAASGDIRGRLE